MLESRNCCRIIALAGTFMSLAVLTGCQQAPDATNETAAPSVPLPAGATPPPMAHNKPVPGGNASGAAAGNSGTGTLMPAPSVKK